MDEFARMMSMEGVRPLDQTKATVRPSAEKQSTTPHQKIVVPPTSAPAGHAWVIGARARTALEIALERLAVEFRDGRLG